MKIPALALVAGALVASPIFAAAAAGPADAGTVFRCATKDGRTVYSDEPCVGANSVQLWKPRAVASGIERSGGPAGAPAGSPAPRVADAQRHDPFVDCQRRGGQFDLTARICRLPEDAARQMFRAQ
ncbi:MAG: DUF4124 domain-containing protein [Burkholderiales bacterium]|nr:MAG: DUF4124 domain-containing protein [Burkholderiales bacterium]